MKFESIDEYGNKLEEVTILYPGGFKPLTGAHIDFIKRYLEKPEVKKVVLFISPGKRDDISADTAYYIAQNVLSGMNVDVVLDKDSYSPILSCYRWIEKPERTPGKYALAASTKGNDYKRVKEFVNNYSPEKFGKNLPKGVQIVELLINADPLTYPDGEPISATRVREDLASGNYEKFKESYPILPDKSIKFIWNALNQSDNQEDNFPILPDDLEEAGDGIRGKEDIYPSDKYKTIKGIYEMGGAAGHIQNVWEASDLTFEALRDIINKSLHGELENITEKLDGQNILITCRDGVVYSARSTKHLKNFGEEAMDIDEMDYYFTDRGSPESVRKAFVAAMEDFQNIFDSTHVNLKKIFGEGARWLNIEILYTDNENVIPYERNQLRIHHLRELDKDGKLVKIIETGKLTELIKEIDRLQCEGEVDNTFLIKKTDPLIIKYITDSNNIGEGLIRHLSALQSDNQLSDTSTIADYLEAEIRKYIDKNLPEEADEEFKQTLAKRWGKGDKTITINKLLKDKSEDLQKWVKEQEKDVKDLTESLLEPFVDIFTTLGVTVLKNLEGLATMDSDKATKSIQDKLSRAMDHLKHFMEKKDVEDVEAFNKKIKEMVKHLERLEKSGGIHSVVPVEGIVFQYDEKILKLTGSFTPLLRIIGFFRFGS
ncbi:MAG: hypothetical protein GYA51_16715 [Candidatus Methanofastidiosa archaeon]|nr:hypothetical protein [Candidatus Methanofastidiosa archaeon]